MIQAAIDLTINFLNILVNSISTVGYSGIFFFMFLGSSFILFPSEAVLVPAGYLAHKGEMSLILVILCGVIGSLTGALLNYYIGKYLGRPFIIKYGKYFMISETKLNKVDTFFQKHGEITTFIGRLIPVIRQYISFPPGISNMNIYTFSFYTTFGALIWVLILVFLGFYIGEDLQRINEYKIQIAIILLILSAITVGIYIIYNKRKK